MTEEALNARVNNVQPLGMLRQANPQYLLTIIYLKESPLCELVS